ncbi:nuclear transport factor 2 family protein [Pseudoclavibacter sp. CFCC 13611]|uniref:nuclear transport factor 2 family protein n=1 Tax=Pseudoclavibacter sp. CFCC 13611 TaxID=2615178 RepID=UPI0013015A70|nr:nuclear transport factor 2 family protein [Pseudoclavibacter sp. CFCC 13611]KAB1664195.1 nuclear transport factor 2 family protein [Pseudoclavibacter sp. CFCC 13611]
MPSQQIPEPVASFIDAVNRHDAGAFLDAFVPDGEVDDWGRVFSGRAAIKTWSDKEFIGATGTLTPTEVTQRGTTVTVVGDWSSTFANGLSRFDFTVTDGKISRMTIREG